jgi:hypothetical protein
LEKGIIMQARLLIAGGIAVTVLAMLAACGPDGAGGGQQQQTRGPTPGAPMIYGSFVGIAGDLSGNVDPAVVAKARAEMSRAPGAASAGEANNARCRRAGGTPTSCAGEVITGDVIPVMGGSDCVRCSVGGK